ncbi:L-aspartate oxidase [bacterium]|nr:L-aspartate oxidase [bacterium]
MSAPALQTDRILIVGGGIAALYAALAMAPRPVLVIVPEPLGMGASSAWAQGGVAAAMGPGDRPADHLADTMAAGAGLVDPAVARRVTGEAPDHVARLAALGAPFDRDLHGGYMLSREAAHGAARVVRVGGDRAGQAIMATLIRAIQAAPHVQVLTGISAVGLLVESGRVAGVEIEGAIGRGSVHAPAVLLAGGGAAGLYAVTTNPLRIRGQMMGMAARAGAVIRDPEFVQFHPTAIATGEDPAPLATEALRGEGAHLVNALGQRFVCHPMRELAPRDIVARAVFAETEAGRRPCLDLRAIPVCKHFPTVFAACQRAGLDPARHLIPVTAAAHYHMGGISVDARGRSALPGLWVAGEAACTGLHGGNRLASNGLLEALVMGWAAGLDIAAEIGARPAPFAAPLLAGEVTEPDPAKVALLRQTMTQDVGVIRDAPGLTRALATIAALEADAPPAFLNMLTAARMIAHAALSRRESRGAQCRSDFPGQLPPKSTLLTLAETEHP